MKTLREQIYDLLPPQPPGLLRAEIITALGLQGRPTTADSIWSAISDLRETSSAAADGGNPTRYCRGSLAPPAAPSADYFRWNEATEKRLRELWAEGKSTAAIGSILGASKGTVIRASHKLDLPKRPSPIIRTGVKPGPKPKLPPLQREVAARPVLVPRRSLVPLAASLPKPPRFTGADDRYTLNRPGGRCQYVTRQRPTFMCSAPAVDGSWCSTHRSVCFDRVRRHGDD